jgi:hypothetical protein
MSVSDRDPEAVARALKVHADAERLKDKMAHGGRPGEEAVDTSAELRKVRAGGEVGSCVGALKCSCEG